MQYAIRNICNIWNMQVWAGTSRLVYGLFLFVTQFTLPVIARCIQIYKVLYLLFSPVYCTLYLPPSAVAYLKIISKLQQRGQGIVSQSRPIAK